MLIMLQGGLKEEGDRICKIAWKGVGKELLRSGSEKELVGSGLEKELVGSGS